MSDSKVVAEIHITRSGGTYGYNVFLPGSASAVDRIGTAPTDTSALERAIDAVRAHDPEAAGRVAVFSPDGSQLAYAPLWCVPAYQHLEWRDTAQILALP